MKLRLFNKGDEKVITSWVNDAREFYMWTAGRMGDFPITEKKLLNAISAREYDKNYYPFVAIEENDLIGFFTMRIPGEDNKKVSFGYVIVNPRKRGLGFGRKMIELGLKFAFEDYGANDVSLHVFDVNTRAYKCYKSTGFIETGVKENFKINDYSWNNLEMIKTRS